MAKTKKWIFLLSWTTFLVLLIFPNKLANFLTASRKFGYHCVYMFHIISPSAQIWQKIISQTNIFNIFPTSVPHNTVSKILQRNCITQTRKYVPVGSL